jgi:hypothetical protein
MVFRVRNGMMAQVYSLTASPCPNVGERAG